jgi:hypothetical protein
MKNSDENSECQALIDACTLELYQKNIFRITGLSVDASAKEVARQAQRLQMMEEMSGEGTLQSKAAFPLAPPPSAEQIRQALARMKEPEHRLVDEFFWYWPEKFGSSKDDNAIQALLAGDAQKAIDIWVEREDSGSFVAQHNLAIMYHMFAVDWTNHHVVYNIDPGRDKKIKSYWQDSFDRWEKLVDEDIVWDVVKERVRSLEDEAITTGFVRRMRRVLPLALDRVNAEAALKFAEQGQMGWAKYHVDFMRQTNPGLDDVDSTAELVLGPTKKRLDQRLSAAKEQAKKQPSKGTDVAAELMAHCKPLLAIFDLFHGAGSHQRGELFDGVSQAVVDMLVTYQKATSDNETFVELLKQALSFATGSQIRERLIKNIAIGENNLAGQQLEPFFAVMKKIADSSWTPTFKLNEMSREILSQLPALAGRLGSKSDTYHEFADSVAIALREISIKAHNDQNDFETAKKALRLALGIAHDESLKTRMNGDMQSIQANQLVHERNTSMSLAKSNTGSGCLVMALALAPIPVGLAYVLGNMLA